MRVVADIFEAQSLLQLERFGLTGGRFLVIERDGDYADPELPQEVLDAIAACNAPPAPYVPEAVTMCQARLALLQADALTAAGAAIAQLPGPEGDAARIMWEFAPSVRRDDPLVSAMGAALGLTSEQIDAMFIAAAAL